jgi:hypothetical protein
MSTMPPESPRRAASATGTTSTRSFATVAPMPATDTMLGSGVKPGWD